MEGGRGTGGTAPSLARMPFVSHRPAASARLRRPPRLAGIGAVLVALALGAALAVLPVGAAHAASHGPGWGDAENGGRGFIGAYVAGGVQVYCIEPGLPAALDPTSGPVYGGWGAVSPDDLARASWAIATLGQSPDPHATAAVNLYIWSLLARAVYDANPLPGDQWYITRVPDPADRTTVLAILQALREQGAGIVADAVTGAGAIAIDIDPVDEYRGTVRVSGLAPAGAVGTLVLRNAVFEATGTATIAGVRDGTALPIVAIPPAGAAPYRVSVDGSFAGSGGWRGELGIYTTPGEQTLAGPGRIAEVAFPLAGADARDRSVVFQPVVTTTAQTRLEQGARFRDALRFALAPDANGRTNRWFRLPDGGYLPVTASCRVYGPFGARPVPGDSPPPGAPLASSFVVTTGRDGPEADYPADSEQALAAIGWYTTQCSIDAGSQPPETRPFLPAGYRFEDGFGVAGETAAVPFLPSVATTFERETAAAGEELVDVITVGAAEGTWLAGADGAPVAIELEGRFSTTSSPPQRSASAPAEAVEIAVQRITVTGPGTVRADPVAIPDGAGWIVARWCVLEGAAVRAACDDWGVPAETVRIVAPGPPPPPPVQRLAATGADGAAWLAAGGLAIAGIGAGGALRALASLPRTAGIRRRARRRPPAPPGPRRPVRGRPR